MALPILMVLYDTMQYNVYTVMEEKKKDYLLDSLGLKPENKQEIAMLWSVSNKTTSFIKNKKQDFSPKYDYAHSILLFWKLLYSFQGLWLDVRHLHCTGWGWL